MTLSVQNRIKLTKQRNNKYCLKSLTCKKTFQFDFFNTLESSKSINFGRIVESYLVGKAPTLDPRNQNEHIQRC